MNPQETSITHSALGWVKKSIDDNLSDSTSDLRRYVENGDAELLQEVKNRLSTIRGVLVMIEQYGAAMLTEEMVALLDFIVEGEDGQQGEQALEVLLRAVLQLPDYLEHIQSGHRDIPIAILPLLNDIRAVRNQDLFSEKLLFLPDLSMHEQPAESDAVDDRSNQAMRLLVKKLRPAYQLALVNIIRDRSVEDSIKRLEKICATLEERSASEQVARIWWIVGALLESVSRQQLELGVSIKNLLGKVDALFRVILIIGERGLLQRQPIELIKNFLYYIAQPQCDGPKTQAIKTAYRLEHFLPSESARSEVLSNIAGPNQALLKTVAEAMKADIETVKSALEVYVNGDLSQVDVLKELPQEMHIISDTLAMIGLGSQRQLIEAQIEVVKQILGGEIEAKEAQLLSMAAELLQVEQALDQMQKRQPVDPEKARSESDVSRDYELDSVLSAVVTAALDNVQKTKDAILEFVKDPTRVDNIELCVALMSESRGALSLLEQPRAVDVVNGLIEYLSDCDSAGFVEARRLEALSQVVSSLEYYLEALGERRGDAEQILDLADTRLRQLLGEADRKPVAAATVAAVAATAAGASEASPEMDTPELAAEQETTAPDFDDTVVADPAVEVTPAAERDSAQGSFDDTVVVDASVNAASADEPTQVLRPVESPQDQPTQVLRPAAQQSAEPTATSAPVAVDASQGATIEPVEDALEVLKSGSDPEILEIYLEEAAEESANIARLQQDWLLHPGDENALKNIRRAFHTIKGSGRLVGATKIGEFAWDFEQLLNRVIDKTVPPSKQVINAVGGAARALPELVSELTTFEEPKADIAYLRGLARALATFNTEQLLVDHTQTMSIVESPYDHITGDASEVTDDSSAAASGAEFGATTQVVSSAVEPEPVEPVGGEPAVRESGALDETQPVSQVVESIEAEPADGEDLSKYDNTELTEAPPVQDMSERVLAAAEARQKNAAVARERAESTYESAIDYSQPDTDSDTADAPVDLSQYDNTELTEAPPVPDMSERQRVEAEARKRIADEARARSEASYERAPDYSAPGDTSAEAAETSQDGIEIESMGDDFVGTDDVPDIDDLAAVDALPTLDSIAGEAPVAAGPEDSGTGVHAQVEAEELEAMEPEADEIELAVAEVAEPEEIEFSAAEVSEPEEIEFTSAEASEPEEIEFPAAEVSEPEEIEFTSAEASEPEEIEFAAAEVSEPEEIEFTAAEASESEEIEFSAAEVSEPEEIEFAAAEASEPEEIEFAAAEVSEPEEIEFTSAEASEPEEIEFAAAEVSEPEEIEFAPADISEPEEIELSAPELADPEAIELAVAEVSDPEEIELAALEDSDPVEIDPAPSPAAPAETAPTAISASAETDEEQPRRDPPDPFATTTATPPRGVAVAGSGPKDPGPQEQTDLSFDPELLTIYQQEVEQHLNIVASALDQAEKVGELVPGEALYRALHTIHGASRTADISSIGELSALLEKPLKSAIGQNMALDHEIVALYREGEHALRGMTADLVASRRMPAIPEDLKVSLKALAEDFEEYTVDLTDDGSAPTGDFIDTLTMMNEGGGDSEQDEELLEIFIEEARELLEMSDTTLHRWSEQSGDDPGAQDFAAVMELQRYLHTLKGGARMAELSPISDLSHEMESLFIAIIDGRVEKAESLLELLKDAFDLLHEQVGQAQQGESMTAAEAMIENLRNLRFEEDESGRDEAAETAGDIDSESIDIVSENLPGELTTAVERPGQDVVKVRSDLLDNLVSSAGEVSIYRARMEQQVAGLGSHLGELGQTISRLKSQLRSLEAETDAQIHFSHRSEQQRSGDFDPLEMDRYTLIQELSRSLSESVNDLSSLQNMLGEQVRDSETLLLQQSRVSTDLQDGLIKSRMVMFSGLLSRLRRLVRQSSQELGKKAELVVSGERTEVDNKVLDRMVAPLEHIIRNALSHGIETPVERVRKGKPEVGKISIEISRDGSDVVLRVSDDGAGVDVDKVRKRAVQLGLLDDGRDVSESDLVQLILEPGFSTAEHVTQLSGRGVGMDVVDIEVKQLGGTLHIETTPSGTTFIARLPFTLAINQAILVRCGEETYAIPLLNIEGITRIDVKQMQEYYRQASPQIEYAGQDFALHNLSKLVGAESQFRAGDEEKQPVILSRAGDIRVALHVDEILGNREIVVKNLGKQLSQVKSLAGASILADGSIVFILDIGGLMRYRGGGAVKVVYQPAADHAIRQQSTVMVVDDSITMRRVASKLLERNNYQVVTAKDGVDALAQLQDVLPDVVLLDIEMPRMDGFELASHMQNEQNFAKIPIIMITSRTGEKHRDRAFEIGVTNYMGKPYQEEELIENIQAALGGR